MARSAGITFNSILLLLGSCLSGLAGLLGALSPIFLNDEGSDRIPFASSILIAVMSSAIYGSPAIWGVITGIGLLKLKEWARISMIIFSILQGLLALAGIGGLLLIYVMSSRGMLPQISNTDSTGFARGVLVVQILFAAVGGMGVWWLIFYTRAGVKSQFARRAGG